MASNDFLSRPETADDDGALLDDFDERLRRGEPIATAGETAANVGDSDAAGAQACLELLERAFPRNGHTAESPSPERIGRFELVNILGQGGFGVVYLARDPKLGRLVALKVPRLHTLGNRTLHERFLREARAAATLEHPNIVPILETGEIGPLCFIASAYCDGADLEQWLKLQDRVAPRMAARIIEALADATAHSHSRGILHRDLKPSNVVLARRAESDGVAADELPFVPRITDFGLAKFAEESLAETGSALLGTPLYMAPEQASGQKDGATAATDVYSLGVILYELLTGRPPFLGTGFIEVLNQIKASDPVPPSRLVGSIPGDLEIICLKCLAKEPERRYLSAAAFQADLQAFLAGRAIAARPAGHVELTVKWVRRHPLAAALGGLFCLAILVISGMQWRHACELDSHLIRAKLLKEEAEEREADLLVHYAISEIDSAGLDLQRGDFDQAARRLAPLRSAAERGADPAAGIEPEWNYVVGQLDGPRPERVFANHGQPVYSVSAAPDGRIVASGDEKGMIKIWNLETGDEIASFAAHDGEVRALVFSPNGDRLASGGQFHHLKIWNTADWRLLNSVDAHDGTITCLDWHRGGRFLTSGGRDGKLRLWNPAGLTAVQEIDVGAVVNCVRITDDGERLWSSDKGCRISQWSLTGDSAERFDLLKTPSNPYAFDFSGDGQFVVTGWGFHSRSGRNFRHNDSPFAAAAVISRSGRWAATEGRNGGISLWRWTDDPLSGFSQQSWRGHADGGMAIAATLDGARLLTAGHDGLVKVWRIADCVRPTRQWLKGHSTAVGGLAAIPGPKVRF